MFFLRRNRPQDLGSVFSTIAGCTVASRQYARKAGRNTVLIELIKKYPGLGEVGDRVEVKPGYCRNFLVPQGFAKQLDWKERKAFIAALEKAELENAEQETAVVENPNKVPNLKMVLERLESQTVLVRSFMEQNVEGSKIATPVTPELISKLVLKQMKIELAPEALDMKPLAFSGLHSVRLNLDPTYVPEPINLKVHIICSRLKKSEWPVVKRKVVKKEVLAFEGDDSDFTDSDSDEEEGGTQRP